MFFVQSPHGILGLHFMSENFSTRAILLLLPLAGLLQADLYTINDLGSFGGPSTVAYGINNSGTAVGWGQTGTGNSAAFISNGGVQKLNGLAGASDSYAYGINSSGTVVGTSYLNGEAHGVKII